MDDSLRYEKKLAELKRQISMAESELAAVRSLLNTERFELRRTVSAQVSEEGQPETEVEKLAREIYAYTETYSAKDAFRYAEEFIAERDRRRRESGK